MATQQSQKLNLKRKASQELQPISDTHGGVDAATVAAENMLQQASMRFEETYMETIAEIKRLLRYYAVIADTTNTLEPSTDQTANQGGSNAGNTSQGAGAGAGAASATHARSELQAILEDLAQKPELLELVDIKTILNECGIKVSVQSGMATERFVDVWMD